MFKKTAFSSLPFSHPPFLQSVPVLLLIKMCLVALADPEKAETRKKLREKIEEKKI